MTFREILRSPWLAGLLAVVAIALLATIVALPQILATLTTTPEPTAAAPSPSPSPSPSPTGPTPEPTFTRPTPSPAPTFVTYRVKSGDSLTSIATTYRTTGRSIAWWNRGTYPSLDPESATYDPNRIQIGWTLVLIPGAVVDDSNPPTPSPGPATPGPAAS